MKSYLQGMITGGVMVFASIVLMGQSNSSFQSMVKDEINRRMPFKGTLTESEIGTYQITSIEDSIVLVDTRNGFLYAFDEASASLSSHETSRLFSAINNLREKGAAILYVSHRMNEVLKISDRISVLRDGKGVLCLPVQDVSKEKIISAMVGRNLSEMINKSDLNIKIYIETRPEGINEKSIELLKKLKVDGVGMGIELADTDFREGELNRFADQKKTINAFKILKENNIKRTAYNIIGLPNQDEKSILKTIEFNKVLNPDNITVAYYSPYYGTKSQKKGQELGIFDEHENDVDSALRSKSKADDILPVSRLDYFKKQFVNLVRNNAI